MIEDAELLRRYAAGNADPAFAELVQRRIGMVYAVALRHTNNPQLAEEVTQTVFTALARKARVLSQRPTLAGWLHRSAQFAASDAVRSERRRKQREQESHAMQQIEREGQEPSWEANRPLLDELLAGMGEQDRDALMLRYYESLGFPEIGLRLRLSENTVRMRTQRALERLRSALARRGVTSTATALAAGLAESSVYAVPTQFVSAVSSTALAEAAKGGAVVGILALMSTPKIIAGAAVTVALLSLGLAVFETRQERQTSQEATTLRTEREVLHGQLDATRARSPAPQAPPVTAAGTSGEVSPAMAPVAKSESGAEEIWGPGSPVTVALSNPESRATFIDQEVLRTKLKFARFFSEAGLSSVQQDAILAQVRSMAQNMLDLHETFLARGVGPLKPPQDPALLFEFLVAEDKVLFDFEAGVSAAVGEKVSRQMDTYVRTVPAWNTVEHLTTLLATTNAPLTAEQANALVRLLGDTLPVAGPSPTPANTLSGRFIPVEKLVAEAGEEMRTTGSIVFPGRLTSESVVTDAAVVRLAGLLSAVQTGALRDLQNEQANRMLLAPRDPPGATMEQAQEFYQKLQTGR